MLGWYCPWLKLLNMLLNLTQTISTEHILLWNADILVSIDCRGKVGVCGDGGDEPGLWGKCTHSGLEELCEDNVIRVSAETVDEPLSRDMFDDILLVIIPHCSRQFIKVHSCVILPSSPSSGQLSAVDNLELQVIPCPADEIFTAVVTQ